MSKTTTLKMYDLAGADADRRFSPYCWRVRLALAHKGLDVETIPWRFTEKAAIAPSNQIRVPVLVDGETWIADSWTIAEYLESQYPDRPLIFGGAVGLALSRFYANWTNHVLQPGMVRFILLDIFNHLHEKDKAYFRQTREKTFSKTLEAVVAGRDQALPEFREKLLLPLRLTLKAQAFLAGSAPLYADFAVFSAFQWARAMSNFALLAPDDPIHVWRERMLDLHGGLARQSRAYTA
jgi:glutathione S-transferase